MRWKMLGVLLPGLFYIQRDNSDAAAFLVSAARQPELGPEGTEHFTSNFLFEFSSDFCTNLARGFR